MVNKSVTFYTTPSCKFSRITTLALQTLLKLRLTDFYL